jgi:hypothetical protein
LPHLKFDPNPYPSLKIKAVGSSETLATQHTLTWHHCPKIESASPLHHYEGINLAIFVLFYHFNLRI